MKSAAFSAIITAGQFVLPDGNVGIAEQSTTRNPVTPLTLNSESNTAIGSESVPIWQVPVG
jgi:hypothetical protein